MQIGVVAKRIGLSVEAIRFYERNALLPILLGRKEATASMGKAMSKGWHLSDAYKVWDSN